MGYNKPDLQKTNILIHTAICEANSRYNDGFTQFEIKKELYKLKWILDEYFDRSPKFTGEDEWIDEMMKRKVVEILKK